MTDCACGQPAEWCDKWCQECWEKEADRKWWEAVEAIQDCVLGYRGAPIDSDGTWAIYETKKAAEASKK